MSREKLKMKSDVSHLLNVTLVTVIVALLVAMPILGSALQSGTNYIIRSGQINFDNPWTISYAGEEKELSLPVKLGDSIHEAVLTNTLPDVTDNTILSFYNQTQWLKVVVGDDVIYETEVAQIGNIKTTVGTSIITVPMYSSYAGKEIKVYMTKFDSRKVMSIKNIMITTNYGLMATIVYDNTINLVLLFFVVIGIVFCLVCRFYMGRKGGFSDKRLNSIFVNLSFLFAASGFWMLTDRGILGIITGRPVVFGIMIYYFFTLLPILFINIVTAVYNKEYLDLKILKYLFGVELFAQVVLFIYGILDIREMLPVTHVLICVLAVLVTIHLIKNGIGEKLKTKKVVGIGGFILVIFVVLAIIAYNVDFSVDYMTIVFFGLVGFEFSIMTYAGLALHEKIMAYNDMLEAERFSYKDLLTGMGNRRAFFKDLTAIDEVEAYADALMVIMDIDGLKDANYQGGHESGDKLILGASEIIKKTFGEKSTYYRIGGDEFAVIIEDWSGNYAALQHEFRKTAGENGIAVAMGAGHLLDEQGIKKETTDWRQEAEISMFADKTEKNIGSMRDNKVNYKNILENLVAQSEGKFKGMQGHSETVRRIVLFIASKLYIKAEQIDSLVLAAKFHDIGIVGIPDAILQKKEKLTDEEYRLIKKHSEIGDSLFAHTDGLQEVGRMIRGHHERYDGKGYPDSLKGDEIPFGSRIIAIADAIDAITSDRPFRDAEDSEMCFKEIEKNAGIMYDPEIVKRVLENWSGIEEILIQRDKQRQVILNPNKYDV